MHRPPTQLGVGLEDDGKFGVINWPRSGVEALIRKALCSPSLECLGFLSPLSTQTSLEAFGTGSRLLEGVVGGLLSDSSFS